MDFIICFIDDSNFEHELVRQEIVPRSPGMEFLQAYTFEEAKDLLGERIPLLFLLDLWGQDPEVENPTIPSKVELEEQATRINTLREVYRDLDAFEGDRNNEFLKRLFTIVEGWRSIFRSASDLVGQNSRYGLENLRRARKSYPGVPAVFYTRKSMIDDAVEMFKAGADGLFIKPTGRDDQETRELTRRFAPTLIRSLAEIIDRHISNLRNISPHPPSPGGRPSDPVEDLIETWKKFRNN